MSAFSDALAKTQTKLYPLQQSGKDVVLQWDPAVTGPILDDKVLVVFPDFHLAANDGGDIFRSGANPDGAGLDRLVRLLEGIKQVAAQFPNLYVIHVGDLYDVWRAYPNYQDHPTSDYDTIEKAYGEALGLLTEQLYAYVCVGNHDGNLGVYPPPWARGTNGLPNGQLAYGHVFSQRRVLALHGHQEDVINKAFGGNDGDWAVRLTTEIARLSGPISNLIQQGFSYASDMFSDDPKSLEQVFDWSWPDAPVPADAGGFRSPRWCDRGGLTTLKSVVDHLPYADSLRLLFVGHSHRAGVSAFHVKDRFVPIIDVGSWVWGSSKLAIATEGEVRLWQAK